MVFKQIIGYVLILFIIGCGGGLETPIDTIKQNLRDVPEYSIILDDMKTEGNFFSHYFHKYRIVQADKDWKTGWLEVSEDYYNEKEPFLGMTLVNKKAGEINTQPAPPGYAYVGDPNYGQWRQHENGGSFWEFYGKYRMFTDVLGLVTGPIFRSDYDDYSSYRRRRAPYFGRNKQYGTYGSYTQEKRPDFYQRRMAKEQVKKSSFSDKVSNRIGRRTVGSQSSSSFSNRIGRSSSGFRSRSSSFGK